MLLLKKWNDSVLNWGNISLHIIIVYILNQVHANACKNSGETGEVFDLSTINSIYNSTLKMAKNCKECNVKRQLLFLYSLNAHVIRRLASCKGEKTPFFCHLSLGTSIYIAIDIKRFYFIRFQNSAFLTKRTPR